jgi:hypothetical protein
MASIDGICCQSGLRAKKSCPPLGWTILLDNIKTPLTKYFILRSDIFLLLSGFESNLQILFSQVCPLVITTVNQIIIIISYNYKQDWFSFDLKYRVDLRILMLLDFHQGSLK